MAHDKNDPFATPDDEREDTLERPKIRAEHDESVDRETGEVVGDPNVYGLPPEQIEAIERASSDVDYSAKHPIAGRCACREVAGELVKGKNGQPDRIVNAKNGARVRIPNPACPVSTHGPY